MKKKHIKALRELNCTTTATLVDNPDHSFELVFEDGFWYMENTLEWDGCAASGPITKKGLQQLKLMFEKEQAIGVGDLVH